MKVIMEAEERIEKTVAMGSTTEIEMRPAAITFEEIGAATYVRMIIGYTTYDIDYREFARVSRALCPEAFA